MIDKLEKGYGLLATVVVTRCLSSFYEDENMKMTRQSRMVGLFGRSPGSGNCWFNQWYILP